MFTCGKHKYIIHPHRGFVKGKTTTAQFFYFFPVFSHLLVHPNSEQRNNTTTKNTIFSPVAQKQ